VDASGMLAGRGIVPVVVLEDAAAAVPLAEALLAGGIAIIEVTLRTADALEGIRAIATEVPGIVVGAGSIWSAEQMKAAQDAGAMFCVSPGSSPTLLNLSNEIGMPFIPGACTPSEMIALLEQGYFLQKFFPAEQSGGAAFLKAVGGPLPDISFMPTGGVTPDNADDYLKLPNVSCVGGSWITPVSEQRTGNFAAITSLAKESSR
jgi:2-dehydro-3-deoxyphosphogluconate aldolase/(4S)-4-hydroxy-2-oxoglutarate aldolase